MTAYDERTAQVTDHSLLRRFRGGDHDAATELYLRYASRILTLAQNQTGKRLASRFDPEDVVQSVFRTFFRRVSSGLYDVPPGEQLWQLLLVISLNKVRSLATHHGALKRDARRTVPLERLPSESRTSDGVPMQILELVIDELLSELPDVQQQMVRLRIEGHKIGQISEKTDRSRRTVERVMQEFREKLSARIDDEYEHSDDDC